MNADLLSLFGVQDSRLLPEAIMSVVINSNEEERHKKYLAFLEAHRTKAGRIDLSRDIMASIYEGELSERKEKKQDFTPNSVSSLASQLVMASGARGSVHEPTAGNGGMLIAYWYETLMSSKSLRDYKPSHYPIEAWELSDRSLPILLLNLSLRGIVGVVIHGDVLEQHAKAIYLLENPQDDPLAFSSVRQITKDNFEAFACEQRQIATQVEGVKKSSNKTPEYIPQQLDLWDNEL